MTSDAKNKRLLITVPLELVDDLEQGTDITNLTKSQLIILCVKRGLVSIIEDYENPTIKKR